MRNDDGRVVDPSWSVKGALFGDRDWMRDESGFFWIKYVRGISQALGWLESCPLSPSRFGSARYSTVSGTFVVITLGSKPGCQVIYSQFGLAIYQNDHQARRRFVEWAQNEIAVVPDFHKRILFSDEAHFWLNGYVNKQNCRIWSEANPQVYVEIPLHPEKLTVWCALWAGGILLQKR
ncbi:uncharacterized protein TNCV_1069651 [Trichonephila clavipes]|nr:uncharacterized protein TNCV_1069651 [Trichonephila clavipes]